jgi:hypothetical protein
MDEELSATRTLLRRLRSLVGVSRSLACRRCRGLGRLRAGGRGCRCCLGGGCSVGGGSRFAVGLVFFDLAVANAAFGEDLNEKEVVGG